ncbi:MAG: hypothetical protein F6J94_07790 [Moorea sp. SIO1F2]|nr:hypothetical protein [Moorena sp. SIO1F2]
MMQSPGGEGLHQDKDLRYIKKICFWLLLAFGAIAAMEEAKLLPLQLKALKL